MEIFSLVYTEKHSRCSVLPLEQGWNPNALSALWALFTSSVPSISPFFHLGSFSSGHFLVFSNTLLYFWKYFLYSSPLLFACKTWLERLCGFLDLRFCCHGDLHYSITAFLILPSSFVFYFASALRWGHLYVFNFVVFLETSKMSKKITE